MGRILAVYEEVHEHQRTPKDDGLSRILAARGPDGAQLSVDDAKRELHHIVIAGLIIWAELATILTQLAANTEVREALRSEVDALGEGPLTIETLAGAALLDADARATAAAASHAVAESLGIDAAGSRGAVLGAFAEAVSGR